MSSSGKSLLALLVMVSFASIASFADAAEPIKKAPAKKANAKQKVDVPKFDLGGIGGELPTADGLAAKKATPTGSISSKVTSSDVEYSVVDVKHAMDFTRGAFGVKAQGEELQSIALYGRPPMIQKFTTLVKVKATQNVNTSIELVVLDPRGDTAMSGNGVLSFHGAKNGEVDYLMDWSPTARPHGGDYKLLVRIAGKPMGTWPLKVVEQKN